MLYFLLIILIFGLFNKIYNNIILHDILPPSSRLRLVESDYSLTIIQQTPLCMQAALWLTYLSLLPNASFSWWVCKIFRFNKVVSSTFCVAVQWCCGRHSGRQLSSQRWPAKLHAKTSPQRICRLELFLNRLTYFSTCIWSSLRLNMIILLSLYFKLLLNFLWLFTFFFAIWWLCYVNCYCRVGSP